MCALRTHIVFDTARCLPRAGIRSPGFSRRVRLAPRCQLDAGKRDPKQRGAAGTRARPFRASAAPAKGFAEQASESSVMLVDEPLSPMDVDQELWAVLDMCSDDELEALYNILHSTSPFSPILKSLLVERDEPVLVCQRGRRSVMHKVESHFRFLAASSAHLLRGARPSYREVLLNVRDKLDIRCPRTLSTYDLETEVFLHILGTCADYVQVPEHDVAAEGDPSRAASFVTLTLTAVDIAAAPPPGAGASPSPSSPSSSSSSSSSSSPDPAASAPSTSLGVNGAGAATATAAATAAGAAARGQAAGNQGHQHHQQYQQPTPHDAVGSGGGSSSSSSCSSSSSSSSSASGSGNSPHSHHHHQQHQPPPQPSSPPRQNWTERVTAPLRLGLKDLAPTLLNLAGVVTVTQVGQQATQQLAANLVCNHVKYQAALRAAAAAASAGGGGVAAAKGAVAVWGKQAVLEAAQRSLTAATARYSALRGALSLLGPLMWGWLAVDLALKAIGPDYARVVRAVFLMSQVRLVRTHGFVSAEMEALRDQAADRMYDNDPYDDFDDYQDPGAAFL